MPNQLAIEYLSVAALIRPMIFIVGAILASFVTSPTRVIGRLKFLGGLIAVIVSANIAVSVVAMLAPPFWTSPNADLLLPGEAVPVISTAHTVLLICMELTIWAISGFFFWRAVSARSLDATGKIGCAVFSFFPLIQFATLPYLIFKGSKNQNGKGDLTPDVFVSDAPPWLLASKGKSDAKHSDRTGRHRM